MTTGSITVLGIFVADLTFVTDHFPALAETVIGADFRIGPGGKGSNQAVAARRAGGEVNLLVKTGSDTFGAMARDLFAHEGIAADHIPPSAQLPTGAAGIYVIESTGENAIIVVPGAAGAITADEIGGAEPIIAASRIFMTQFEIPLGIVEASLRIARAHGVTTILNPAPAAPIGPELYTLADVLTPNETEAAALCGQPVESSEHAESAADFFLGQGVGTAIITLGGDGAFIKSATVSAHVPAFNVGAVVETTGAGDAFNGALAVALSEDRPTIDAVRFACAAAGVSVTRAGTAPSMPSRAEIEAVLRRG